MVSIVYTDLDCELLRKNNNLKIIIFVHFLFCLAKPIFSPKEPKTNFKLKIHLLF